MRIFQNGKVLYEANDSDVHVHEENRGMYVISFCWENCPFDAPAEQRIPLQISIGNTVFGTCQIRVMRGNINPDVEIFAIV